MLEIGDRRVRCQIDPALGGSFRSLRIDGRDIWRPAPPGSRDILATSCFPLVPFANRIDRGRLRTAGRDVLLPADPAAPPHAHHGHGWRRPWRVEATDQARATLILDHEPDAWPWRYRAIQRIACLDTALEITLELLNLAEEPMPSGLGIHPYFPRNADSALTIAATAVLGSDADGLPTDVAPFRPGLHDIATLEGTDNLLIGAWTAIVGSAGGSVRIDAAGMAGFHLYVPAGGAFFCVEPVSHRPNSFAATPDSELLGPGEAMVRVIRIGTC